ncbi:unnamed protein product, partial [Rotaria sp. Silwood1]
SLNELEKQMVLPFEFCCLHIEQPDHYTKLLHNDPCETVPDLSIAVYERCVCIQLTVCETARYDTELLRANPRLVTK